MCRSRLLSHVYVTPFVAPQPRSRFVRLLAASQWGTDGSFKRRAVRRAGRAADALGRATGAVRGREGDREVRREIAAGRSAQEQGGRALAVVRDSDATVFISSFALIFAEARRAARFVALPKTPHVVLLAQHAPLGVQRGRRHHARHCGK